MKSFLNHQNHTRVPHGSMVRVVQFRDLDDKANWLDGAASLDSMRGGVRQFAAAKFLKAPTALARVQAVQRYVRDGIKYESDFRVTQNARGEEFADAETMLRRGYEDCDGKARLFVGLLRALEKLAPMGVAARIRPVFKKHPLAFVHVQGSAKFPGSTRLPNEDGWVLAELILKGCELGQNPDDMPRDQNGQRIIA